MINRRKKDKELYSRKKLDPEFLEQRRLKAREYMREKRLKEKQLKEDVK